MKVYLKEAALTTKKRKVELWPYWVTIPTATLLIVLFMIFVGPWIQAHIGLSIVLLVIFWVVVIGLSLLIPEKPNK